MNAAYSVNEPTTLCWTYIHTLTLVFVEGSSHLVDMKNIIFEITTLTKIWSNYISSE